MSLLHDRFVAPARIKPSLPRLAAGILLSVLSVVVWTVVLFATAWLMVAERDAPVDIWLADASRPDTAFGTLLTLASFLGLFVGPMLAVRWLHKRKAGTLFGPRARVLRDFVKAFLTVSALMAASLAIWSAAYKAVPNLEISVWLSLLPLTLVALLIQTGAEELLFRGYLQQQLAARFSTRWIWFVIPSVLFGLVHFSPANTGETAWLVVGAATAFGLAAADLTARTGSIGAAWGFHFANNLFAVAVLSTKGTITGLSLWTTPYSLADSARIDPLIVLDLGFLVLAWWLVRRVVETR